MEEQNLIIRKKYQEIGYQLSKILNEQAENDHEFFLNLLIAQKIITEDLQRFQDIAFLEWIKP